MFTCSRRALLSAAAAAALRPRLGRAAGDPWDAVPEILKRIQPPAIPEREFPITRYGAKPGGKTDCTEAFARAIAAANTARGGRVVVPEGEWHTGAIHLRSNVNLHLTKSARSEEHTSELQSREKL